MADRPEPRWSRLEEFCAANNIPLPAPMTPAEIAEWHRRNDEADADAARLYGLGDTAAA